MQYYGMSHQALLKTITLNQPDPEKTAFIVFFDSQSYNRLQTNTTKPDFDIKNISAINQQTIDQVLYDNLKSYHSLILKIDDVDVATTETVNDPTITIPSRRHAEKIAAFIAANHDQTLYVSCTAGVSRTGAVIHYLDMLTHNPHPWTHRETLDAQNNLVYYWCNDYYVPNLSLDQYLQEIVNHHRLNSMTCEQTL